MHSGKLTWQWKMEPLKMYFLLGIVIFYCYVSLPGGMYIIYIYIIYVYNVSSDAPPPPSN